MKFFLFMMTLLAPVGAWAEQVTIDPSTYGGSYCVNNRQDCYQGTENVELAEGRHTIIFAPGNGFSFDVDADGIVSLEDPFDHAAQGGDKSLKFLTSSIGIDFGQYAGRVQILGATDPIEPTVHTFMVEVVNGVSGWIFHLAPGTAFRFDTNETGSPVANPVHASVNGRTLSLNTTTLTIDPNGYLGDFGVVNINAPSDQVRRVQVIPGIDRYLLGFASGTALRFDVDQDGNISRVHSTGAEGDGAVLRFLPIEVPVTPLDLNIGWFIIGAEPKTPETGARQVILVPDVTGWALSVGPGTAGRFSLDSDGAPTPPVVPVFDGNNSYEFQLYALRDEVRCQFSGTLDLRGDLNPSVPKQAGGGELSLTADMVFEATPFGQGSYFAWYHWDGEFRITDQAGQSIVGSRGAFLLSDDGIQRMIGFHVQDLVGSLGNEQPMQGKDVALALTRPVVAQGTLEFPSDLSEWNSQPSRLFVFRAFQSGAFAKVSQLSFRALGCY